MVSLAVREPAERFMQARLIGVAGVAPFFAAASAAIILPPVLGTATTLALIGAIFLVSLLSIAMVRFTGRTMLSEVLLLASGTGVSAIVIAAAGGLSSPAALLLAGLVFEAWWVRRTVRAALAGAVAALIALAFQFTSLSEMLRGSGAASAAHWVLPIACLGLIAPRLGGWLEEADDAQDSDTLEDIIEAVVIRMDLSGDVADVSSQAVRILGMAPEMLLSNGLFERIHVGDRVGYLCALSDLRETAGFGRVSIRVRVAGALGEQASDFRNFTLELMRRSLERQEITALLRADEQGALAAEATQRAEAAETANLRLLAAVSHELRTPLNCIIGFSDMLLHETVGTFSDPRQKEYVGLVKDAGNHLLSVVNSVLDVSQLESGAFAINPEAFPVAETIGGCRQMLAGKAAEKGVALTTTIPEDIGELHADQRAIRQILINLVSNAIKFTPGGGAVSVGVKRTGARLQLWVSDNGVGIHENDLGRIGRPFVQAPNNSTRGLEGTGLGLSLVKGLVAAHKGTLSIESEPGHGTTVTISLPVEQHPRTAIDLAETRVKPADRSKETSNGTYRKTA